MLDLKRILQTIFIISFFILIIISPLYADNILKIGFQEDIKTLNYWKASDTRSKQVLGMVYDSLYVYAPETYNITSWLADGQPDVDYNALTADIKLRRNIKWSDGEYFNADDVIFTAEILIEFEIPKHLPYWEFIDRVEKIDDFTVRFYLKEMRATFIHGTLLTQILPEHIWEDIIFEIIGDSEGAEATQKILNMQITESQTIGTGPFILKEWNYTQYISMETNDDYFMKGRRIQGRSKTFAIGPHIDGLLFRIYRSTDSSIEALKNGEIDFFWWEVPVKYIATLTKNTDLFITKSEENGIHYLAFNLRKSPFKFIAFRKALSWLIDRNYIEEKVLMGYGKAMYSMVPPDNKTYYNENVEDYGTIEKLSMDERINIAKGILTDAGFVWNASGNLVDPEGQVVEPFYMLTPTADYDPIRAQCAVLISDWWENVSVYAIPKPATLSEIIDSVFTKREFDTYLLAWDLDIFPDYLRNIFHSSQNIIDGRNSTGYADNAYDDLSDDFISELNPAVSVQKAHQLQNIIAEKCAYIPLYTKLKIEAHSRKFNIDDWIVQLNGTGNIWSFLFIKPIK